MKMSVRVAQKDVSEEELIELVANGSEEGFKLLYTNYSAVLYGISLKIVGSEAYAKDVLQDAFVKIWKNFSKYDRSKGRLFTWMLNITRNTALDFIRSKESKNTFTFSTDYHLASQSNAAEMEVDHIGMSKVLSSLNPESKSVLECVYIKGYTHSEAADLLCLPLGTVKTRLRNGLIELRKMIN